MSPSPLQLAGIVCIFGGALVGASAEGPVLWAAVAVAWAGMGIVWLGGRRQRTR